MKKLGILFIALVGFGMSSFGQASATASGVAANATIVAPITISKNTSLSFGTLVSGSSAGTAVISTASVVSGTGGVTVAPGGTKTAANFTVGGTETYTYTVVLPTINATNGVTITGASGTSPTMKIHTFTHNATGTLGASGETFSVGATLAVGANQTPDVYTGSFDVTVNYN